MVNYCDSNLLFPKLAARALADTSASGNTFLRKWRVAFLLIDTRFEWGGSYRSEMRRRNRFSVT